MSLFTMFFSSSLNIWSLTVLTSPGFILYSIIPWKYASLGLLLLVTYFQQRPSILPAIQRRLLLHLFSASVTYHPLKRNGTNCDPLTASIMSVAAQIFIVLMELTSLDSGEECSPTGEMLLFAFAGQIPQHISAV
ncbi:hypothetical protein DL96DRAFT_262516 [Flagelloscypha sp. PMI_526]|nr:hypothetical protein DL96DRAFT_262516 [Flagelloscypha sp. PMI_526]